MATLEIEGRRVEVDDGFLSLSPQEQERTVEEIAEQMGAGPKHPVMSQVNRGIADAAGGLVDLINPFDQPHSLNPFPEGTGSAQAGLTSAMEASGIEVAQGEPETVWQGLARGTGEAAGALIPATKGLQALSRAPGIVGQLADDAFRALASVGGATAEVAAGAVSEGAREGAEEAGAPPWLQDTAAIAAGGAALPALTAAPRYAPFVVGGKRLAGAVKGTVAPYTEAGGREVARRRMQNLAGGKERAQELARQVESDNEFGLTPAQQTQDPNMLGVERLAADQDPALRSRLDERRQTSQDIGRGEVREMGGDPEDAAAYFEQRREDFAARLRAEAQDAMTRANRAMEGQQPRRTESENSLAVGREIDVALDRALMEENRLWDAIPRGATVGTGHTKHAVESHAADLGYAQRGDLPQRAREVLSEEEVYGDEATVRDLHSLYSELRRVARSARAGNDQNNNMARVADDIANAILKDLGAVDVTTDIGRAINEARAFAAARHETFDRGAVGRLLTKTLDGDTAIDPELTLSRTVGRQGTEAMVTSRQIETATDDRARPFIEDYIKDRFQRAAVKADDTFTAASARKFIRDNAELLQRYPELKGDIEEAVSAKQGADQFARRVTARLANLQGRNSVGKAVIDGRTVQAILGAKSPAREARRLANEARRDRSGKALAGVKASFADELIRGASGVKSGRETFSGDRLLKQLSDPKTKAALRQVFSAGELGRLQRIARTMAKLENRQAADIGPTLSGEKPSKVIEFMARIVAARHGAELGGAGGGSLQTAQMASSRTKEILGRLVSDKASDIMARAVEDPDLFRALMTDVTSPRLDDRVLPRIIPYLVGTTASQTEGR